jgi:hypothetical protein
MSFVFICINVGRTKRIIVDTLVQRDVPFVDVGMGVNISDNNGLGGILRVANAGLAGWRRSADRTGLHSNSLQTGNFTGIMHSYGFETVFSVKKPLRRRHFLFHSLAIQTGNCF